jgi:hypothetical protein
MKIIILAILLSLNISAVEFSITNLCEDTPYLHENIEVLNKTTVSELSLYAFETYDIPFLGDSRSINSILNTATGLESYEVISDHEMKVYGWCFQVNGIQPDRFMDQITIDPSEDIHINWFYGFAHFLNNEWIAYCTPAFQDKSPFVCKK